MALKVKTRTDTAATWTSTNPVLSAGEVGTEYDTRKFKIGDGSTVWNSLSYKGVTGPAQTKPIRSISDGSDGNVTISSGTTTLTRDMYYNNLTMSGTGSIDLNSYRIFVKGVLDITAAAVGAIKSNGANGGNASGTTAGAAVTVPVAGSVGIRGQGAAGRTGTTAAGSTGNGGTAGTNGGSSNASGAGGTGTNAGGGQGGAAAGAITHIKYYVTQFLRRNALINGGYGGPGGGGGGGDGTNNGGGSGAGGNGGGITAVYANIILKGTSTPAGVFQANGGNGGNGGNSDAAGVTGGGGGGSAGGGGWLYIAYNMLAGPTVLNIGWAHGGSGGQGGNGFGTGAKGGNGGAGGNPGIINVISIMDETKDQNFFPPTNTNYIPAANAGSPAADVVGGSGGNMAFMYVSF